MSEECRLVLENRRKNKTHDTIKEDRYKKGRLEKELDELEEAYKNKD